MGQVFRAEDRRLSREVSLKFMLDHVASEPMSLERFWREARRGSRINHPNNCTVHDINKDDEGGKFLVREFLAGETLEAVLKRGPVPLPELISLGTQITGALEAAHNSGIIRRDIKPANIFITDPGDAKVLDFGLATSVRVPHARPHDGLSETLALDFETSPGQVLAPSHSYRPSKPEANN